MMLCRLDRLKADLAGVGGTTVLDGTLVRAAQSVSAEFEGEASRSFAAIVATRYFDAGSAAYGVGSGVYGNVDYWESPGGARSFGVTRAPRPRRLYLTDDLLLVSAIAIDQDFDGIYETSLSMSDYHLWPYNAPPYRAIDLPLTGSIVYWPNFPRSVQVVGTWGYSDEKQSAGTLGAAISSTTATSLTMTAGHDVQLGDTLCIEDEQLDVTAVATNTVTVTRGINGTTAATHLNGTAVSVRRYPRDVEMAVAERVVGLRWDAQGGYQTGATLMGEAVGSGRTGRASFARWRDAVNRYAQMVVV